MKIIKINLQLHHTQHSTLNMNQFLKSFSKHWLFKMKSVLLQQHCSVRPVRASEQSGLSGSHFTPRQPAAQLCMAVHMGKNPRRRIDGTWLQKFQFGDSNDSPKTFQI